MGLLDDQMFDIMSDIKTCTACELCDMRPSENDPSVMVPTANKVPPEYSRMVHGIMLVGEAPGKDEANFGKPFVGVSGKLLRKFMRKYNISGIHYIDNICHCRPPANRTPRAKEVSSCYPFLQRSIATLRPKVIMAIGGVATNTLLGYRVKLGSVMGSIIEWNDSTYLVPCYHPAAAIRSGRPYNSYLYHAMNVSFALTRYVYDNYDNFQNEKVRVEGFEVPADSIVEIKEIF